MKKNLIVIHLESLSTLYFSQFSSLLPNISQMFSKSLYLNSFYSSATSSLMAITDFLYGNSSELDHYKVFESETEQCRKRDRDILSILMDAGYSVAGLGHPVPWRDDLKNHGISNHFRWIDTEDEFLAKIEFSMTSVGKPFALFLCDVRSHLWYSDPNKQAADTSLDAVQEGYRCIDRTVGHVINLLSKHHHWNDTIVVCYGDHGDEFWGHSFNGGFCHGFEPYTNITHTPACIFDSNKDQGVYKGLVSLVDFKATILGMLEIPYTFQQGYKDRGIDIFSHNRDVVFSQNLLLCQLTNPRLLKAFSVTNQRYHLVASELGLEMFAHEFDFTNQFNLLNVFSS